MYAVSRLVITIYGNLQKNHNTVMITFSHQNGSTCVWTAQVFWGLNKCRRKKTLVIPDCLYCFWNKFKLENKSSAVAEMGDRLATIDMGRKERVPCPFCTGKLGPRLIHCGLCRSLLPSWRQASAQMGTQLPPKKGAHPPIFDPCLLWPNSWMD